MFGNGFYAVTKRQKEGGDATFQPTLKASTQDLGGAVEIRIRDNGVGIPPEIRDRLFQPFFTTNPTGEGTGLGLSISWDIVTQQHAGTIAVDSRVGGFTESRSACRACAQRQQLRPRHERFTQIENRAAGHQSAFPAQAGSTGSAPGAGRDRLATKPHGTLVHRVHLRSCSAGMGPLGEGCSSVAINRSARRRADCIRPTPAPRRGPTASDRPFGRFFSDGTG
ncbi:MAG TPA: ATP-binding protein [Stellaceae bacterium]|nr:ATP-binding protein [Stellaceae bacterium]